MFQQLLGFKPTLFIERSGNPTSTIKIVGFVRPLTVSQTKVCVSTYKISIVACAYAPKTWPSKPCHNLNDNSCISPCVQKYLSVHGELVDFWMDKVINGCSVIRHVKNIRPISK